jgi:hypothetical protein
MLCAGFMKYKDRKMEQMRAKMYPIMTDAKYQSPAFYDGKESDMSAILIILWIAANVLMMLSSGAVAGIAARKRPPEL